MFGTKKRAICIGMMLVLTTFVGIVANVSADEYPVADTGGPYVSSECSEITFDASHSYDPLGGTLEYRWNFEGDWTDWSYYSITQHTWLDDFTGTITLEVRARGLIASDTTSVTVSNAPPTITNIDLPPDFVNVGDDALVTIHFYDGDPRQNSLDTYEATFFWGDGSSSLYPHGVAAYPDEDMTITGDHVYTAPGVYSGSVSLIDDNGGLTSAYFTITVVGSAMVFTVDAGPDGTIDEGSVFISDGSFYCSIEGSFTGFVDYGDGFGPQTLPLNDDYTFTLSHQYNENDDYSIMVTIIRDNSVTASDDVQVTVANVPPSIISLSATNPTPFGTESSLSGTFSDPGILDDQTAVIDWGDGSQITTSNFPADSSGVYEINEHHLYASADDYSIMVTVTDDDGGSDSGSVPVTVVGPEVLTVDAGPDAVLNEGSSFVSAGSFTDSVEGIFSGIVDFGDGFGPQALPLNPDHTFALNHQYQENGVYSVLVTIDRDNVVSASDSALVTVNNVPPTATLSNNGPKDEGSPVTVSFTNQYDPGVSDTFSYSFDWNNDGTYEIIDQTSASAVHTWYDNGAYTVKAKIKDKDGGFDEYTTVVTVNNVPPTATLGNNGPFNEGSPATVTFTNQYDPGTSDTFTYSFDWNNDGVYELSNQASATMTHTWYDNGAYTVKGKIQDDDGGFNVYTTIATVLNVPPTITSLSGPPTDPILLGMSVTLNGVFTDPGTLDTHVAVITWDDGSSNTVNLAAGVYQVSKSHTYTSVGVYVITLTVTDKDGGSDTKSIESYVVVFNPSGGFVTGGGWLISPAGSYPADPTLTGRVNFGFVCKYKKGQTIPDGETEFQFQLANINFHSDGYEWLVIVGPKATYQGYGTVNGQGHYGFKITVIDGKQSGGGGVDKFRIKIWNKDNNDQVIYDTDCGAPDTQNPSVALSGGQITIHKA